jgi:AcrR family transcriptional regulator
LKDKIAYHAIRLFDKKGFHGTAMRDIGEAVQCKMPTVYYYYKNKEELFDRVVRVSFEEMIVRLENDLPKNLTWQEACINKVIQKKNLSDDDRITYRLAIKTWLGFEGCETSRQKLLQWEQNRYKQKELEYAKIISSPMWIKFITRSVTSIIERIILFEEKPSDDEIREEIEMIFEVAMNQNKSK